MTVAIVAAVIWLATLCAVLALGRMSRMSDRPPEPPTVNGVPVDEMTYRWDSRP